MGILQTLYDDLCNVSTPEFLKQVVQHIETEFESLKARLDALEGHPAVSVPPLSSDVPKVTPAPDSIYAAPVAAPSGEPPTPDAQVAAPVSD
jgi:hypothetical protein